MKTKPLLYTLLVILISLLTGIVVYLFENVKISGLENKIDSLQTELDIYNKTITEDSSTIVDTSNEQAAIIPSDKIISTEAPSNDSLCDSNNEIDANNQSSLQIQCGDIVILSADYKESTGYKAFPIEYDSSYFELLNSTDIQSNNNDLPGGDSTVRTYRLKSIKQTSNTNIIAGIHQDWDTDNTREIQDSITISIN